MYRDDQGSILPLMAVVLAMFVVATTVVTAVGRHAVAQARSQAAADAAALAGAAAGEDSARRVATANGVELVSLQWVDGSTAGRTQPVVVVSVELDGVRAVAAASRIWTGPGMGPYPVSFPGQG